MFPLFQAIIYRPDVNSLRFLRGFTPRSPNYSSPHQPAATPPSLSVNLETELFLKMDISKTAWINHVYESRHRKITNIRILCKITN